MKFEEALGILQKTRPQAQPNSGFVKQLIAFEKQFICF
jgi:hypothetical protein